MIVGEKSDVDRILQKISFDNQEYVVTTENYPTEPEVFATILPTLSKLSLDLNVIISIS